MIFDRPTNVELVEVVSEFLEKEIKINLPDHLAFKTQIAINVLNICLLYTSPSPRDRG